MIWQLLPVQMMHARHDELIAAIAGLRATGTPLVGLEQGRLFAVGMGDFNVGMYFLVSIVARATGLSADGAATLFLYGILGLALLVGGWGWWRYARSPVTRLLFVLAMMPLTAVALYFGDEYMLLAAAPIACVPPLLAMSRRGAPPRLWTRALLLTGLAAGTLSLVRAEAGVAVFAFAVVLSLTRTGATRTQRALQVGVLGLGMVLPALGLRVAQLRRDAYLARAVVGYRPPAAPQTIWHSTYIGFGFLANDKGLAYKDDVAALAVARVAPGTRLYSPRYNAVIRHEVFRLIVGSPAFVARTVFAKVGVLLMYLLVFANIGLVAAVRVRKPVALELAFAVAGTVAAVPGIMILPVLNYMEGFAAVAVLYALTSIDWALAAGRGSQ